MPCDVLAHHLTSRQIICGPAVTPLHVLSLMARWLLAGVACLQGIRAQVLALQAGTGAVSRAVTSTLSSFLL